MPTWLAILAGFRVCRQQHQLSTLARSLSQFLPPSSTYTTYPFHLPLLSFCHFRLRQTLSEHPKTLSLQGGGPKARRNRTFCNQPEPCLAFCNGTNPLRTVSTQSVRRKTSPPNQIPRSYRYLLFQHPQNL